MNQLSQGDISPDYATKAIRDYRRWRVFSNINMLSAWLLVHVIVWLMFPASFLEVLALTGEVALLLAAIQFATYQVLYSRAYDR